MNNIIIKIIPNYLINSTDAELLYSFNEKLNDPTINKKQLSNEIFYYVISIMVLFSIICTLWIIFTVILIMINKN